MSLPRILVIDDQFGRSQKDRRNLCINFALKDVTGDDAHPEDIENPVAEACFCSSQTKTDSFITNDASVALSSVENGWPHSYGWFWSMVLLDIRFASGITSENSEPAGQPGDNGFGIIILEEIVQRFPDLPVVILSSRERHEVIEECRRKGALDFIQRVGYSSGNESPKEVLREKIFQHALIPDTRTLYDERLRIVGNSIPLFLTLRAARRAATGAGNILIIGETGTGKELLAKYVHDVSPKASGPYQIFHPFGTAETLQEDNLFGHVKGSYTGATADRKGLFEIANAGTLLIDEIGDISENLQQKLLRPLESRVIERQGGNKGTDLDLQVVLTTNKNLEEYARTGRFKLDLLNRINAYMISIPPLRERKNDILPVANKLLEILCRENNARWPRKIQPDATQWMIDYDWPDNVRGLRNVLEKAVKNNKDSELVVFSDIRLNTIVDDDTSDRAISNKQSGKKEDIEELIHIISNFPFPKDYKKLFGRMPGLQDAVSKMMIHYLKSVIEATKKMRPNAPQIEELNLTGAASCMVGRQLKTAEALDLVKRLLRYDRAALEQFLNDDLMLKEIYNGVLKKRPTTPNSNNQGDKK